MKIGYKIYCYEHVEEITIVDIDIDPLADEKVKYKTVMALVKPCSQCMSESYEKGIESLLSKEYARNEREI